MPKVSDFKEKHKKKTRKNADIEQESMHESESLDTTTSAKSQRRPGNIHHTQQMDSVSEPNEAVEQSVDDQPTPLAEKLEFFGSEALKEHVPTLHRSLEIIVDDWKNDGRFEGLPLGHPLFQALASVGLQKAKKIEKKLDERGVFMMARMGSDIVKMKINELRGKKE